jgi:hypothetical protein
MTISSSSSRPDDSLITPAPAAPGIPSLSARLPMRSAPLLERVPDVPLQDDPPYGDPLDGLVRAAVADRPVEDVVRLITLLERSPEHARTTADALRAAAVGRSVEDVTRLVTLLTEEPRGSDSADEAIRTAAERRSLDDVTRLMRLLHRTPVGPRCGQAAVQAVAVGRPVEELAELISLLAADRSVDQNPLTDPAPAEAADCTPESPGGRPGTAGHRSGPAMGTSVTASQAVTASQTAAASPVAAASPTAAASPVATVPGLKDRTRNDRTANDRAASDRAASDRAASDRARNDSTRNDPTRNDRAAHDRAANERMAHDRAAEDQEESDRPVDDPPVDDRAVNERSGEGQLTLGRAVTGRRAPGRPAKDRHAMDGRAQDGPVRNDSHGGRSLAVSLWGARAAAVLVLLCGIAHAPRYWSGLSQGALGATVVEAGLCMLLALVLPARAAQARLVATTAAVGVTTVLAAGRLLGRFSPPGLSRVWDATLAPPWLAGTAATVAAVTALAALAATLVAGNSSAEGGH